jgi:predicted nucleotidyltransferase
VEARTRSEIARRGLILRATVGSTAHGLHLAGTDDRDEMGVCIEPPEYVLGLHRFEHWVHRTAEDRARARGQQVGAGHSPRSEAGDLDLVVYSLRKYARLAAAGNPTVLILLFAEPLFVAAIGRRLQANADMFASRQAGQRYQGYLRAQREKLLGQRGQMRVTRQDLIDQHGFDTKFAMHALRLGYQGVEYLQTGRLTLPMAEPARSHCFAVRQGRYRLPEVVKAIEEQERALALAIAASPLPEQPVQERIDRFLVSAYVDAWSER